MGKSRRPHKVKLFVGLLFSDDDILKKIKRILARHFGPVDYESALSDFTHTDYYSGEMGPGLKRVFLSFKNTHSLKRLYCAKLRANSIERRFSEAGKRTVNIDPGYLDMSKVVLFSTKDYTHRIYIDKGIFAESTLYYKDGCFNPWPWTYPDYKSAVDIFESIRNIYKSQVSKRW